MLFFKDPKYNDLKKKLQWVLHLLYALLSLGAGNQSFTAVSVVCLL